MWRSSQFRLVGVVLAIPCAALFSGVGTAGAASLTVDPVAVVEGGNLIVSGEEWIGDVAIVFVKGNTAIQAGSAPSGPNGGPISITVVAPPESGAWQVCASGTNRLDMQPVSMCAPLNVTPPAPTPPAPTPPATNSAPTTNSPSTTNNVPSTTDTGPNSTVPPASMVPSDSSPGESSSTSSVALAPPGVPGLPDGISEVDEGGSSVDGSGLSGLTIGTVAGIVAVTGLAIVGLASSNASHRPRRSTLVGIGLAGAVLAGATAIAMPPPKLNVPKLSIVRVQNSATITRGNSQTITANCPAGLVVVGGGWWSDWSSARIDDIQILVNWMETYETASGPLYVLPLSWTSRSSGTSEPSGDYHLLAREDGTVHYSDQIWPSGRRNWLSVAKPGAHPLTTIRWSEELASAMRDQYYFTIDLHPVRQLGLLLGASMPVQQGWRVDAGLAMGSLQTSVEVQSVALCAEAAGSIGDDGVMGARIIEGPAFNGLSSARCASNEVALGGGWKTDVPNGVSVTGLYDDGAHQFAGAANIGERSAAVGICAKRSGLETSIVETSTNATGGFDGSAAAQCPAGWIAVGGSLRLMHENATTSRVTGPHQTVMAALPTDARTFSSSFRGYVTYPTKPSGRSLTVEPLGVFPLTAYGSIDTSEVTIGATCARRVMPES